MDASEQRFIQVSNVGESLVRGGTRFVELLQPLGVCLGLMTLIRFLLFINAGVSAPAGQIVECFVTGFRFDLLIWGFLFLPAVLVLTICQWSRRWPRTLEKIVTGYLGLAWVAVVALSFADLLFFGGQARHLSLYDLPGGDLRILQVCLLQWPIQRLLLLAGIYLGMAVIGAREFSRVGWWSAAPIVARVPGRFRAAAGALLPIC